MGSGERVSDIGQQRLSLAAQHRSSPPGTRKIEEAPELFQGILNWSPGQQYAMLGTQYFAY